MHSHHHLDTQLDQPGNYSYYSYISGYLLDRLQQPSVIVPLFLILFTVFYQSLHFPSPLFRPRHPRELLWDFIVTITPSTVLYAINDWLHPPSFPVPGSMLSTRSRSYTAKSDILGRILGMDGPGSIITSVADAGRRSLSSLSSNTLVKYDTDRPPGLGNYDNSCFQNSILQGLSALKPFPQYLVRGLELVKYESDEEAGSTSSLRDLISKLTDTDYNGKTLWTPKTLKSLDTWQQQDAQEYFSKILDEVEKEIMKAAKPQHRSSGFETVGVRDDTEDSQHSDDSGYQSLPVLSKAVSATRVLRNPLEGLVAQRVACVQCGHSDGLSMIPFNCITLNLGLEQSEHDLYERLDSYTDLETIGGVECAKCTLLKLQRLLQIIVSRGKEDGAVEVELLEPISRLKAVESALEEDDFQESTLKDTCKVGKRISSTKTKQIAIARPPQSLAVHMNRSVFDENTGHMFKNLAAVRFPRTLDLGPWCLGSAGGPVNNDINTSTITPSDEEQWVIDPTLSMVSGNQEPSRISGPIYELRAVITHQGRHENGHYVCYRRHPYQPSKLDTPIKGLESLNDRDEYDTEDDEGMLMEDDNDGSAYSDTDAKWWRLSDESVWEVPEETVLAQGGVFMLFYDCVDPNSVLVSTTQHETKISDNTATYLGEQAGQFQRLAQTIPFTSGTPDQVNDDNPKLKANNTQSQRIKLVESILIPFLADGETVDPAIPIHRPNR